MTGRRVTLGFVLLAACRGTQAPTDAAAVDVASASPLWSRAPLASSAPIPVTPTACTRTFAPDADLRATPEGTSIAIADFFQQKPSSGRFTVEGFLQAPHHCQPCPPGALCKPCEEYVFLSEAWGAFKGPIADGVGFRISVPDAARFTSLHRYRMTVDVCASGQRELRGYRDASP